MAYFRCSVGGASGGGNGADLIVTCSSAFAGTTITCSDGSTYTRTQTCPSTSPYEVTFESIPTGTYTISGVKSGQTFSTVATITDFDALLTDIPDGATVTPTNDIQILLNCANIWDKAYTTISQLLADTTSLLAVISDNNAVDYLVRSTTFASSVCADSTAMIYIGADDYCADTLLSDSTWRTAICNSTYFESVLNVKVPTMTSDTAPSGVAFGSNYWSSGGNNADYYKVFDNNTSTSWYSAYQTTGLNAHVGYEFTSPMTFYLLERSLTNNTNYQASAYSFDIEGSNDGTTYYPIKTAAYDGTTVSNKKVIVDNVPLSYKYIRVNNTTTTQLYPSTGGKTLYTYKLQFYGRAAKT